MNLFVIGYSFSMLLKETNWIMYESGKDKFCGIDIFASDTYYSYSFSGLGLCRGHLERIIEYINLTLNEKITGEYHLQFADPRVVGGGLYSPMSFMIHGHKNHGDDYWEFVHSSSGGSHNSGKSQFSIGFNKADIANFRDSLSNQIHEFNWDEVGKTDYYMIELTDNEFAWCYSETELQSALDEICTNSKLIKVLVGQNAVLNSSSLSENSRFFNGTGSVLLVFDNQALEILVHAEGLMQYRVHRAFCIEDYQSIHGYAPDYSYDSCYYNEVFQLFKTPYQGNLIRRCVIETIDEWPYSCQGFDESKVSNPVILPAKIFLQLDNGNDICIWGDDIDDFGITIEPRIG